MIFFPDTMANNEDYLTLLSKGWKTKKHIHFVQFVNELLIMIDRLAERKSHYARKVYQIII